MKRIAVIQDARGGWTRGIILGLADAVPAQADWELRLFSQQANLLPRLRAWRPDALVAGWQPPDVQAELLGLAVPFIGTGLADPLRRFSGVILDQVEIGRLAAEYFRAKGFRQLVFLHDPLEYWWLPVLAGLRAAAAESGLAIGSVPVGASPDQTRCEAIQEWLAGIAIPMPIAVCAPPELAVDLARVCRTTGRQIPEEILILALEDQDTDCRLCSPQLSAVHCAGETAGRRCGQMLAQVFAGTRLEPVVEAIPPTGIVERASTRRTAVTDPLVADALERMREESGTRANVAEIASGLQVSRRTLELRFQAALGCSPLQALHRLRFARMKQLLSERTLTLDEIARRFGYGSGAHFSRDFARHAGATPARFQARFARPPTVRPL